METHRPTTDLDALAQRAGGIVTRAALLAAGWSESRVLRGLRSGLLIPVAAGVYRVRGAPWSRQASRHAALAVAGPGAVLARWSAADVLGFADPRPGPHQVVIPHERRAKTTPPALVTVHRSRHLEHLEVTESAGVPTTTAARTLLDLASALPPDELAELAAEAARTCGLSVPDLEEVLDRHPHARGRRRLRVAVRVLGEDGGRSRSGVEVAALAALLEAGLPRPEVGYLVRGRDGRVLAEVDLAYPALRLAIEIDGYRWHSSPARKLADEERQNRLVLAGWTVLRFSAAAVRASPAILVEAVATALRAA